MSRSNSSEAPSQALGSIVHELNALSSMTVAQLREKYLVVFGVPSASRNRDYLRKKLAWRIQELAEGGLSDRAKKRIEDLLAEEMTFRFRRPANNNAPVSIVAQDTTTEAKTVEPEKPEKPRDPRLPSVGTVLRREYKGVLHEVVVLEEMFEFRGQPYRSLSHIARVITGTGWNGFVFFGLSDRGRKAGGTQ